MATTRSGPDGIRAVRSEVEITRMAPEYRPDPDWSFTDAFGHSHTWAEQRWRWVFDGPESWFDADGFEHGGDGHYECVFCRSPVDPGMICIPPTPHREFAPGRYVYEYEDEDGRTESITDDRYRELLALARSSS